MKKLIKFGVVLFVGGLIATFIGWRMGGAQPVAVGKDWRPKIVHEEVRNKTLPTITEIDLDVTDANIAIQRGKRYGIRLEDRNVGKPTYRVSHQKLTVTQDWSDSFSGGIDWQAAPVHNIIITVPESAVLTNVKINNANGQINLTDNYINRLETSQGDGDLFATRGTVKNFKLNSNDGNVHLTQLRVTNGQAKLRDGSFEMDSGKLTNKLVVNNYDGLNRVNGVAAKGYYLQTTNGKNRLKSKTSASPIIHHADQTPLIKLINHDANNVIN